MPLLTNTTDQLALDRAELETRIAATGEALNHLAAVARQGFDWLWSLPTERLLAVLNADVTWTLALFSANTQMGEVGNGMLDLVGLAKFRNRFPVVPGRSDIQFVPGPDFTPEAPTGEFVHVPQAEEPAPDPEPEP